MILNRLRLNTLPDSIYLSWVCLKAVLDSAQMDSALSGQRSSWTQRCPCALLNQHLFYIYIFKMMFGPYFFTKNIQCPYEQAKNFTFFCMKMFVNTELFSWIFFHIQFTGIIFWPLCASKVTQTIFCSPARQVQGSTHENPRRV